MNSKRYPNDIGWEQHDPIKSMPEDFQYKTRHGRANSKELRARLTNMPVLRKSQLAGHADYPVQETLKAIQEPMLREQEMIHRLSRAAEYRDPETGAHLLRMAQYSRLLTENLGLPAAEQDLILAASPVHDIGKVGIPDHILLKPGRFSDEERAIMQTHSQIGADILSGSASPLMQAAAVIALTHHEKFDGSGYPHGLKGQCIPLHGRIVAVADVFDALTSSRPYKPAWEVERAATLLREEAGRHFDAECINAFFKDWDSVLQIHRQFQDENLSSAWEPA